MLQQWDLLSGRRLLPSSLRIIRQTVEQLVEALQYAPLHERGLTDLVRGDVPGALPHPTPEAQPLQRL